MNSWMKIILSFFLCLSGTAFGACGFKSEYRKVYSLAGPMTVVLKELNLLSRTELLGVSIFNPVSKDEFKGKFLPGGIFLAREMMEELKKSLVFFDEGRELSRLFNEVTDIKAVEIKTRGLSPEETVNLVADHLRLYTNGCESEILSLKEKSKKLSERILTKLGRKLRAIFLLGKIRNGKLPELVMVNDGIVKWLKEKGKLTTYPSELGYLNWSAKIMNELEVGTLKVGVEDSAGTMMKEIKKVSNDTYNFIYPGALVPGLSQQEAWLYLIEKL